jgi:hypothetical protein
MPEKIFAKSQAALGGPLHFSLKRFRQDVFWSHILTNLAEVFSRKDN